MIEQIQHYQSCIEAENYDICDCWSDHIERLEAKLTAAQAELSESRAALQAAMEQINKILASELLKYRKLEDIQRVVDALLSPAPEPKEAKP